MLEEGRVTSTHSEMRECKNRRKIPVAVTSCLCLIKHYAMKTKEEADVKTKYS
jgi:hypothetical protein